MRRVLVTGATSTIGAKVVGRRCERRVRARAFVRGAGKAGALLDDGVASGEKHSIADLALRVLRVGGKDCRLPPAG